MKLSTWPRIRHEGLFAAAAEAAATSAQDTIKEAEDQAAQLRPTPRPTAPNSADKESDEPELERVNVWIGSSRQDEATTCRVMDPAELYEEAKERDGVALVYIVSHPSLARQARD
jgi:hypothetical protein